MNRRFLRDNKGFNLIELMVAIVLTSTFAIILLGVQSASNSTTIFIDDQILLTENGQRALGTISRELRHASRDSIEVTPSGISYRRYEDSDDTASSPKLGGVRHIGIRTSGTDNDGSSPNQLVMETEQEVVVIANYLAPTEDAFRVVKEDDGTIRVAVTTSTWVGRRRPATMTFHMSVYPGNN
jgi:prepilin-type N-terminal cleavage/methylation domain-containing protein